RRRAAGCARQPRVEPWIDLGGRRHPARGWPPAQRGRFDGERPVTGECGTGLARRAVAWWYARAPRERWMLTGMCAAIAAFVAWYGLLGPLQGVRQAAADRHADALMDAAEIEHGLAA